jgi:murein L,D-transpeptidase YcbB/YkuD
VHKRSLSSGCVKIRKPLIMAAYLLNDGINRSSAENSEYYRYKTLQ